MVRRHPVWAAVLIGLLLFILLAVIFLGRSPQKSEISAVEKQLRLSVPSGSSVTEYKDTTGWFGDGEVDTEIRFPKNADPEKAGITPGQGVWQSLPMPDDLVLLIYGGLRSDGLYGGCGDDWIKKTKGVKNGAYFFGDRNEVDLREKISPLQNRYSNNFTFALYDHDMHTLYYFTYDS
jgi:hypothetical protein